MGDEGAEAGFHAGVLLQLYDETESVEAVTTAAAKLLAKRSADYIRQVAWFLPPELVRVFPKPAPGAARSATADEPRKAAAS
jgi:hypothetical protein